MNKKVIYDFIHESFVSCKIWYVVYSIQAAGTKCLLYVQYTDDNMLIFWQYYTDIIIQYTQLMVVYVRFIKCIILNSLKNKFFVNVFPKMK